MRCHSKQQSHKDFIKSIATTMTAKFDKTCIVHVINNDEMKTLKTKGVTFIHLKCPICMDVDDIELVNWVLDSPSIVFLSEIDLLKSNIAILTKYQDIKNDQKLSFVGTIPTQTPQDNDFIMLALILQ